MRARDRRESLLPGPFIDSASRRRSPAQAYRKYLAAIWSQPAFGVRLLSVSCFGAALAIQKGAATAGIAFGGTLVGLLTVGFLLWLIRGRR